MIQFLKNLYASFCGRRHHWTKHRKYTSEVDGVFGAVNVLTDRFQYPKFDRLAEGKLSPILILSAGWRSGSTLLQRLICSSSNTFLWGEPFGDAGLLSYPASTIKRFTKTWPREEDFVNALDESTALNEQWIANLHPELDDLRCAFRVFFDQLFVESLVGKGINHWGFKEVRLSSDEAKFFQWIYPGAKIIFLVRNPIDAYISYAPHRPWYDLRPDSPVITARQFASHWQRLASSFVRDADKLGALLIKYEDLVSQESVIADLELHIGLCIDHDVVKRNVNINFASGRSVHDLLPFEKSILRYFSEPTYSKLGYN